MLKGYTIIAATLIVLAPSVTLGTEDTANTGLSEEDAYILLDKLLRLDAQPGNHDHQFQRWKKWESVFVKYYKKSHLNITEMKIYLFMNFIAQKTVSVHTMEEISRDILPKFKAQPEVYLSVLKELPFLTESSCRAISSSFGYKAGQKAEFVKEYRATIMESLGDKYGAECLKCIQELH